jgi:5-methyltetrahydrofolate--homocysteine methyltransferase
MSKRLLTELAREMRRSPTRSEEIFWQAVRDRRLNGVKFRRQQVIERFIVDFFVPSHRLVIEIDGGVHQRRKEYDTLRQQFLDDCGLRVLRFTDKEVVCAATRVLRGCVTPSPPAGEGAGG